MTRLIRSELLKIRTTHTWWLFGLGAFVALALAFLVGAFQTHSDLHPSVGNLPPNLPADQAQQIHAEQAAQSAKAHSAVELAKYAVNLYTSGQFLGLMFVMLIGILVVTNEFYHQTATATFLTEPHRTKVIMSKLLAAIGIGVTFWLITTIIDVIAGTLFFQSEGVSNSLGEWAAQKGILLNLLAYLLWAILGVGIGVLIRSQIGATVTAALLYTIGTYVVIGVLSLIHNFWIKHDWVMQAAVFVPSLASVHMISGLQLGDVPDPPRWLGAVVLIGYAVIAGFIGTMITRKRDIS
jgi:ABC-2 type transport system permease protein